MNAPLDLHAALPPHMAEAVLTAGLPPRPHQRLSVLTRAWYWDGCAAVDSGIPAGWPAPDGSQELTGYVCSRQPLPDGAGPCSMLDERDVVRVGRATISAAYYAYVVALWPGVTWELGVAQNGGDVAIYAVAIAKGRPVALVMPMVA